MRMTLIGTALPLLMLAGCGKDDNKNNQPTPDTQVPDRNKFLRSWAGSSCRSTGYTITITRDPSDSNRVLIGNLLNEGKTITGVVQQGGATAQIPQQAYSAPDTAISGYVNYIQGGTISFETQKYVNGGPILSCGGTGI